MVSLIARTPLAGQSPMSRGTCTLSEWLPGPITAVAPFAGREKKLSAALKSGHGLAFPAPNRFVETSGVCAVWSGRDQAFLIGADPAPGLSAHAALTDQSDGWAALSLQGTAAPDVLARLIPLDLRAEQFAPGHCARSSLQHTMALILRTAPDAFRILVMRSFATTAWHELAEAMASVAARG